MKYLQRSQRIDGVYQNPVPTVVGPAGQLPKIFFKLLTGREERVPRRQLGPFVTDPSGYRGLPASGVRITWLGHSTLLLEIDGVTILTDPVWGPRSSPVSWFGPKRFYAPPLALADLPHVDLVLLSHDHYDHLDAGTMRLLAARVPLFVCSLGVGEHLRKWGVESARIRELDWTESLDVEGATGVECVGGSTLRITALPTRHFAGRTSKRNRTLWSSFVLKTAQHNLYYGADSGYYPGFAELGAAYGPFDLTMLEIGASDPLWPEIHLGPDNAIKAHLDLSAAAASPETTSGRIADRSAGLATGSMGPLLPIHWGLFNLALHAWYEPVERMVELARAAHVPLLLPAPGQPVELVRESFDPEPWWVPFKS